MTFPQSQRSSDSSGPSPAPPIGRMRLWNITTWLIAINIGVFALNLLLGGMLYRWGYFSVETTFFHWQLWRLITFQFLHGDVFHILFNMVSLWWFGPLVENRFGRARYLAFYLICGTAGALMAVIFWRVGLVIDSPATPMIGASAGVFGVLIACVKFAPNMAVRLLFPPILLRMQTLAWIFIGLAVLAIVAKGANAGGEAAHLGGAFAGWLLASNHHWLNIFDRKHRTRRFWRPGDPAENFFRRDG